MCKLPKRSKKHGVGKVISGKFYVHRNYESVFGDAVEKAKTAIPDGLNYVVVKFNVRTGSVSFVESEDFDTSDEPTVGSVITVRSNGTISRRSQLPDPQIYHHKWLFVTDDYDGFDVEASKDRSRSWLSLDGVDKSRIGTKSYWEREVVSRLDG